NGWSSDLLRLPEHKCTVVVLTNGLPPPPKLTPSGISRGLAEKLLAEEIKKLPAPVEDKTVDPKSFADYAGRYDYQGGVMVLTVTRDGAQIFAQLTGQPKFPIFAIGEDEFEWKVVAAKIKFEKDKEGNVTKGVHSQGGGTIEAPRVK